jgi:hypothetical protein
MRTPDLRAMLDLEEMRGRHLVMQTPVLYQDIVNKLRGRIDYRIGQFYLLSESLGIATGGSWNRETGDIWLLHRPEDPAEERRCFFHELTHALNQPAPHRTTEDDWMAERITWEGAKVLATDFGFGGDWTNGELEGYLEDTDKLEWHHMLATELAGHPEPILARAAYDAFRVLAHANGWTPEETHDHLERSQHYDWESGPIPFGRAPVDIDRSHLRSWWSVPEGGVPDFGPYTREQQGSAAFLSGALADAVSRVRRDPDALQRVRWLGDFQRDPEATGHHLERIDNEVSFNRAIFLANSLLLAEPERVLSADWTLYAAIPGGAPLQPTTIPHSRIYRLQVRHGRSDESIPPCTLWLLIRPPDSRVRRGLSEAGLQRYIRSWLKLAPLSIEPLDEALEHLWSAGRLSDIPKDEDC